MPHKKFPCIPFLTIRGRAAGKHAGETTKREIIESAYYLLKWTLYLMIQTFEALKQIFMLLKRTSRLISQCLSGGNAWVMSAETDFNNCGNLTDIRRIP